MSIVDDKIRAMEARLRREMRAYIDQRVQRVATLSPVSLATSDGKSDGVAGLPSDEDSQQSVSRIQHAGFRSRPPKDSRQVVLAVEGGSNKRVAVAEDDGASVALDAGEASAYSPAKPAARALFTKDGDTKIDADISRKVLVNGGGKGAARLDHKVGNGTMVVTFAPGTGAASLTIAYHPGDGSATQTISGVGGTLTIKEKIVEGSASIELKAD
jgi:phage gp45-like